jgi:hypothetical protein
VNNDWPWMKEKNLFWPNVDNDLRRPPLVSKYAHTYIHSYIFTYMHTFILTHTLVPYRNLSFFMCV